MGAALSEKKTHGAWFAALSEKANHATKLPKLPKWPETLFGAVFGCGSVWLWPSTLFVAAFGSDSAPCTAMSFPVVPDLRICVLCQAKTYLAKGICCNPACV
jgi:hypothetical protein